MKAETVTFDGKTYVSAKRAADLCGYTTDYVGQLARSGKVLARRVGRGWFVEETSLLAHKDKAEQYVPTPPPAPVNALSLGESTLSLDGLVYISAKRAGEITSYHQDYIGQLAREGKIQSRQIAGVWYVAKEELLNHKQKADHMLRAVQARSVGLYKAQEATKARAPMMEYKKEHAPLLPVLTKQVVPTVIREISPEILDLRQESHISIGRNNILTKTKKPRFSVALSSLVAALALFVFVTSAFLGVRSSTGSAVLASAVHGFQATSFSLESVFSGAVKYERN